MEYAVRTRDLTRRFGKFTAVDRLTLDIRSGEICGFLGPNGAGKSTAIRMLCGILEPTSGRALVAGYDVTRQSEQVKKHIGYMSQKFSLYEDLTVRENLEFYAGMYGLRGYDRRQRLQEMVELSGLKEREGELVAHLSGGFRQRLALGCAIIARPSIVFLDEPTSGVSPTSRRDFFAIIKQLAEAGTTVIVTTHFMDEAERCNRIAFISRGALIAYASPSDLKEKVIQGYMVEVETMNPVDRLPEIEKLPYVRECTLHGALLHVLLDREESTERLHQEIKGELRPITPSLEDVFVNLSRQRRAEDE